MKKFICRLLRYKILNLFFLEALFLCLIQNKYSTDQTTYVNIQNLIKQQIAFINVNIFSVYCAMIATTWFLITSSFLIHKYGGKRMRHNTLQAKFIKNSIQEHNYNGIPIYTALYQYPINKRKSAKIALAEDAPESFPDTIDCYYTSSKKDAVVDQDQLFSTLHISSVLLKMFLFCFSVISVFYFLFA